MRLLRRYPIISYFVIAYGIAWGGTLLLAPRLPAGTTAEPKDILGMAAAMFLGPTIAGVTMTWVTGGAEGLRDLLARMGRWRVNLRWYAVALLFPALILAVLVTLGLSVSREFMPQFIGFGILAGLFAGFFEEIGWTGFAFPTMKVKYGTLLAAVILGALHGVWHFAAGYIGEAEAYGVYWLPRFVAMWFFGTIAWRILWSWVYVNTKSVLLGMLMHASSTGFLVILSPAVTPAAETLWFIIYVALLVIAAAVVVWRYGPELTGRESPDTAAPARLRTAATLDEA